MLGDVVEIKIRGPHSVIELQMLRIIHRAFRLCR